MKHLRKFNKINEERSLTFNDVMSSNWEKTFPYDGDGGVLRLIMKELSLLSQKYGMNINH